MVTFFTYSTAGAIVAIIIGILLGLCLSYAILAFVVKKSCDMGDSKGKFGDFCDDFKMTKSQDRVSENYYKS